MKRRNYLRLINRADGVDGHYCIARDKTYNSVQSSCGRNLAYSKRGYTEFWNGQTESFESTGTVYSLNSAVMVLQDIIYEDK